MARFVDVHLVMDSFDRQFNTWRNIARLFARTDFVMMLDIDFAICTDFRHAIRASEAAMEKLREGSSAFVIPAFEYVDQETGNNNAAFPTDKTVFYYLSMPFHAHEHSYIVTSIFCQSRPSCYVPCVLGSRTQQHRLSKILRSATWRNLQSNSISSCLRAVYHFQKRGSAVVSFSETLRSYEQWKIHFRCDERFVGYGGNKAACLFEMYLSGVSYYVLSDHFIVHQNHLYEEKARKDEVSDTRTAKHGNCWFFTR